MLLANEWNPRPRTTSCDRLSFWRRLRTPLPLIQPLVSAGSAFGTGCGIRDGKAARRLHSFSKAATRRFRSAKTCRAAVVGLRRGATACLASLRAMREISDFSAVMTLGMVAPNSRL